MAEHATASHGGACSIRLEAASQLDGESLEGIAMITSPSDGPLVLSMSALPGKGRWQDPAAVSQSCRGMC